jgi:uncharacterized protein (TIGR02996 family)
MLLLDHFAFLDKVRENPADVTGWLVYADWLDEQDDPTGAFVRHALDFTAGDVPPEENCAHITRFHELAARANPATRELMAEYRSNLPLRLQVCDCLRIGHHPPRDMFGYARTVVIVAVLTGRLVRGAWLRSEDRTWRPSRPLQGLEVFMKVIERVDAGTAPGAVGLFYLGHHDLPTGAIIVEAPELDVGS